MYNKWALTHALTRISSIPDIGRSQVLPSRKRAEQGGSWGRSGEEADKEGGMEERGKGGKEGEGEGWKGEKMGGNATTRVSSG